jgi:hypothetical protein
VEGWSRVRGSVDGLCRACVRKSGCSTALMISSSDKEKSDNAASNHPSPKPKYPCQHQPPMHGLQSLMLALHTTEPPLSHRRRMQPQSDDFGLSDDLITLLASLVHACSTACLSGTNCTDVFEGLL